MRGKMGHWFITICCLIIFPCFALDEMQHNSRGILFREHCFTAEKNVFLHISQVWLEIIHLGVGYIHVKFHQEICRPQEIYMPEPTGLLKDCVWTLSIWMSRFIWFAEPLLFKMKRSTEYHPMTELISMCQCISQYLRHSVCSVYLCIYTILITVAWKRMILQQFRRR